METPLTPLEFVRRARKLYGRREAVVDGELRLTYAQFFDAAIAGRRRCSGSASARATASPTSRRTRTRSSSRSTPCRRSARCWCRINYRLTADDFAYMIDHSGARVVCAHADYLDAVDSIRDRVPRRRALRRARGRARTAGSTTRATLAAASPGLRQPGDRRGRPARRSTTPAARPRGRRA